MSHAAIIEAKGTAAIAEVTGQPRAHVRVWKNRGIPRSMYAPLIVAFPDVSLADLQTGAPTKAANDAAAAKRAA